MESVFDFGIKMIRTLSKTEGNKRICNFVRDVANFMNGYCNDGADTMCQSRDKNCANNSGLDCEIVFTLKKPGFNGNYKISNKLERLQIQKWGHVVNVQYLSSVEEGGTTELKVDKSVFYDAKSGVWCLKENDAKDFKFTLNGKKVEEVKEGTATAGGEGKI